MKKLILSLIFISFVTSSMLTHCNTSKPSIGTRISTFFVKTVVGHLPKKITLGIPAILIGTGALLGGTGVYLYFMPKQQ